MALEIERKFLVNGPGWKERSQNCQNLHQGYLAQTEFAAIRIRVIDGTSAFLTIKSANPGVTRTEFEYPIPVADAEALFMLRTGLLLEKQRHVVPAGGFTWEVDVFGGA